MSSIKTSRAGKSFLLTLTSLFCASPLYAVEKQAATQAEFNAALGQADTTSIRLTGDIVRTTDPPVSASTAPLGIEGDGHTLDGNNARRVLNLRGSEPGDAANRDIDFIRSTRFINGSLPGSVSSGNNPQNWGGAIRVTGSVLNGMQDVQFENNSSVGAGGALFVNGNFSGGLTTTTGAAMPTFFRGNKSGREGAAVYVRGAFNGGLADVEFSDNEAGRVGTFHVGDFLGDITNVTFDSNRSTWTNPGAGTSFGGAGFVSMGNVGSDSAPVIIRDSTFTNQQAALGVQGLSGGGGAFSVASINPVGSTALGNFTGSVIDSLFRDNTLTGVSGSTGVFGGGMFIRFIFKGNIEGSQFLNNKVIKTGAGLTGGGAIALGDLDGSILGTDSNAAIFRNNSADRGGAIQVLRGITGSISGTASNPIVFEDNHATSGEGGAMRVQNIDGGIHYGQFSDNSATQDGGAIRATGNISGGIDGGSVFENNQAGGNGGALALTNNIGSRPDGVGIDDVTFRNNTAQGGGGAIRAENILGRIQDTTFTVNQALQGGAIYTSGSTASDIGISEIASTNFENNTAGTDGGAIWGRRLTGNLMDSVTFKNNQAVAGSGGAMYAQTLGGNVSSQFQTNTAGKDGGAMYAATLSGKLSGLFTSNTAAGKGGAVYAGQLSGGVIDGAQFRNNRAQQAGGALYVESTSGSGGSIANSLFLGNRAQGASSVTQASGLGGAIAARGNSGNNPLVIDNSLFLRNRAETQDNNDLAGGYGGAVFFEGLTTNSPTLAVRASGSDGKTLFYGNTNKPANAAEASYNAIHIGHLRDAGQNGTVNLRIETNDTAGDVLMFDPISSQADNLAKPGGGNYGKVTAVVTKTGVGNWFLGGQSQMRSSFANWFVSEGALHLVTVDYGSGAVDAQINLLGNDSAAFILGKDGNLAGSGSIAARNITLNGYLAPNTQVNTGVKATDLDPDGSITQADIDSIDVEESSTYGKLAFDTLGSGSAVTMDGAVYEVDLAWNNAGEPVNDLIDIQGALNVRKSTIDVRGLSFQTPPVSAPGNDTEWDFYQPATVIKTTDGITGDFQLAVGGASWVSVDYLRGLIGEKDSTGKNYDLRLGLSWYAPLAASNPIPRSGDALEDPAHGTFTLTDASNTFTVDGELKNRAGASESGWNGRDLTKEGDGALILNGANTYTGLTRVNAGVLTLGDTPAKSTAQIAGNVQAANATLDGYGTILGNVSIKSGATQQGDLTTQGMLTVENGGTLAGFGTNHDLAVFQSGSTVTPGGADFGTLTFGDSVAMTGTTFVADVDGSGQSDLLDIAGALNLNGSGNVVEVRNLTFAAALPDDDTGFASGITPFATLIKTGAGIQGNLRVRLDDQISGADYLDVFGAKQNGDTEYALGLGLRWNSTAIDPASGFDKAHGSFTLAGGKTFTVAGSLGNRTVNTDAGGWDGRSLNKLGDGALILNGVNTYTGATTVTQGSLTLGDATHATARIGGALQVASGATFTGTGTVAGAAQIDGTLTGTGRINGNTNLRSGARVAPGFPDSDVDVGTLRFGGNVAMDGARYDVKMAYGAPVDLLDIGGTLNVNGNDNVINATGLSFTSVPPAHNQFGDGDLDTFATIIKTGGGITGADKFNLRVANQDIADVDFAQVYGGVRNNEYKFGIGLSWYSNAQDVTTGENTAHGDFTLLGDNRFVITGELADRTGLDGVRWNGRSLAKKGTGTLVLNGVNTYTGETVVQAGALVLGDTWFRSTAQIAGNVTVENSAVFSGYGSVLGNGRIASGATLASGDANGIGTTMTFGSLTFDAGSTLRVKARDDGTADRVNVAGDLTVHGGVVDVQARAGAWSVDRSYTVLAYGGARAGSFDGVTSNFAFLTPVLDYTTDSQQVILRLARNDATPPSPDPTPDPVVPAPPPVCMSANQCSVGGVIRPGSPVYATIETASVEEARAAYDNLSGEIYGSTRAAILGNRYLRDAMRRRMLGSGLSADDRLWLHTWGQNGHISGDGNAAKADMSGIGLALGVDVRVNDNTQAGVVFGYEDGKVKNGSLRNSRASIDAYSLGVYAATQFDSVSLRAGVAYSYLDIDTKRDIRAGTLQGQVKSDYKGQKVQAFAEVARDFRLGASTVSPYVGLAQVWLRTKDATESGNAAALDVRGRTDSITQTTLGVRGAVPLSDTVSLTADLGWVHSLGDVDGKAENRFAAGNRFAVRGVGVDKNMALVGLGVQAQLAPNTALSLGYQGQLGSRTKDHSAQLQVRMRF